MLAKGQFRSFNEIDERLVKDYGSADKAWMWVNTPCNLLSCQKPITVLGTAEGIQVVLQVL
jgi:uncharacterized protein (DUF2384 family)